jgi:phosphohydrolase
MEDKILKWAIELQSLAQAGLYYGKDIYDIERFQRIREIASEMVAEKSGLSLEKVNDLFCCETGYQTPKLDTRAAIFQEDKILLVQERNGKWSLPGGWVDVDYSIKENTIKEVWEEAGLEVSADRIIAIEDRDKHNKPEYIYKVCKVFVLCTVKGGEFKKNIETLQSGYFSLDELPELSEDKNSREQIEMCFEAYKNPDWKVFFD